MRIDVFNHSKCCRLLSSSIACVILPWVRLICICINIDDLLASMFYYLYNCYRPSAYSLHSSNLKFRSEYLDRINRKKPLLFSSKSVFLDLSLNLIIPHYPEVFAMYAVAAIGPGAGAILHSLGFCLLWKVKFEPENQRLFLLYLSAVQFVYSAALCICHLLLASLSSGYLRVVQSILWFDSFGNQPEFNKAI